MHRFNGYDIEVTRGDSLFFKVDLTGRDLPEGSVAYFTVKTGAGSAQPVIKKKLDATDELLDIRLSSADTDLPPRTYFWDVRVLIPLEDGGYEVETPMEYASFTVLPAIGDPGDDPNLPGVDADLPVLALLVEDARRLVVRMEELIKQGFQVDAEQVAEAVADYLDKNPIDAVTSDELEAEVRSALQAAAESGEFKGDKGEPFTYEDFTPEQLEELKGDPGYTPIKGKDYFDGNPGYTPVKGLDYFTPAEKVEIAKDASDLVNVPVESVNGQIGAVVLDADDVGALPADTPIPAKTSDLTNDSGFIGKAVSDLTNYYLKSQTYTRDEINQRISAIPKFTISVVSALPTSGISETTIYLVSGGEGSDLYTEYIYVNGAWEILGSQRVDLTGYATETWVIGQLAGYQPVGDYATKSELPTVPTKLSQLSGDSTHRVVTDVEKAAWNGKLDADKLPAAVEDALAQAKASGEFDGEPGYTPVRGTDYWTPADQEAIKEEVSNQLSLEIGGMPEYVKAEAESVIERVSAAQTGRAFTFAAITDMHYGNADYTDGVKHACQALKYIDERIKLDAVAVLGDYTDGYPASNLADAFADFRAVNSILNDLRFAPNLRTQGNHDYYADNAPKIRRHIQAYSEDVVWGDIAGGYYHKDLDVYKLRVIVLNTTETGNANIGCTTAQYQWFADTLDMSAKDDAAEWQILILSHHPLDWYHIDESYALARIANAYREGTTYSITGVSCNYSNGKNAAVLIGNIHGHIHNLLVDKVHVGNVVNGVKSKVDRMATPESCINRANQYTDAWQEETSYPKTIGTAEDTSFVVYCIDLDTYTIQAVCYGAGYDRTLTYYETKNGYTNQIPISIDSTGAVYNGQGYKTGYRLNSSGAEVELADWEVTGFIPIDVTKDILYFKNIQWRGGSSANNDYVGLYDANFAKLTSTKLLSEWLNGNDEFVSKFDFGIDENGDCTRINFTVWSTASFGSVTQATWPDVKYVRFSLYGVTDESIITKNEPIE